MPAFRRILPALLSLVLLANPAFACSWAAFANGGAAVVARTMDWYSDDNAVVKGYGRDMPEKAADTPNAMEYASRYASIRIHSFAPGIVAEAMNEKGLQGSILFLDGSELPPVLPGRKDVDPNNFLAYAVANFATVGELVEALDSINFIPAELDIPYPEEEGEAPAYEPNRWPGHFAFADAGGDKAIIEFVNGEVKVYHGPEHDALTNEPSYDIQTAFDFIGYIPNGSISTIDRRMRARHYLRDMRERGVDATERAILAMRGLLASVNAGAEELDPVDKIPYPTIWSSLADLNGKKYYVSHYDAWRWEKYDFSMFSPDRPEAVLLEPAECP